MFLVGFWGVFWFLEVNLNRARVHAACMGNSHLRTPGVGGQKFGAQGFVSLGGVLTIRGFGQEHWFSEFPKSKV